MIKVNNSDKSQCNKSLVKKIKTLLPSQITSQEVADRYFTPRTELTELYLEGKQSGHIQIGGDVSWVTGDLAEMDMGTQFFFSSNFQTLA